MPKPVGIDLGTTYSCVAFVDKDEVRIIHNSHGNYITPSVVSFDPNLNQVGEEAVGKRGTDPKNTVYQIKRFMGRLANDDYLKKKTWPFEVLADRNDMANIRVCVKDVYHPEQVSSMILRHMKDIAETFIGEEVKDAVVTVPANFTDAQRQATKDAGRIAGLNILRLVNEPTAAAIAYGHAKKDDKIRNILVYDLGGGTFDVSIVEMKGLEAKVKSTQGITFLGGEDFDYRLYEEAVARFREKKIDVPGNDWYLIQSCEKAKCTLSNMTTARIEYRAANGNVEGFDITRETFEDLCDDLFEKTIDLIDSALQTAQMTTGDIDDIVLVGGSSRIPRVQKRLKEHFGDKPLRHDIQPDHAVAHGAALLAQSLSTETPNVEDGENKERRAVKLADVTPHSLGVRLVHDRLTIIVPKNTPYPFESFQMFNNAYDNASSLWFGVYEGDKALASENHRLGEFQIAVQKKPVNGNNIKVNFAIDENGILKVTAIDLNTNRTAGITVESGKLSAEERERMMKNAQKTAEEDMKERKRRDVLASFSDLIYRMKRILRTGNASEKSALEQMIVDEEVWFADNKKSDVETIRERVVHIEHLVEQMRAVHKKMARKAIGIDLGTTYSCVAYTDNKGTVQIVSNSLGNSITPSVVNFESKVAIVGEGAVEKRGTDPKNTVFQIKRFMGRNANDEKLKQRKWPFEIIADEKGSANIRVTPSDSNGRSVTYCPEQISAQILRHMKGIAEKWIGNTVTDAVITVPANFSDLQRQATKDAGSIAGLNVLRIVNEPTAASLAYGEGKGDEKTRKILVYDFGGGTFDVSIVEMKGMNATVKSTAGLPFLGGEDFDYKLYEEAVARFKEMNVDVAEGDWSLMKCCEQAKRTLSNSPLARIEYKRPNGKDVGFTITVDTFNDLCEYLFEKTIQCVDDALEQAKYKKTDIDDIVLVGGSSRIPRVQQLLSEHFNGKHKLRFDIQPDHAVAHGAALLVLEGEKAVSSSNNLLGKFTLAICPRLVCQNHVKVTFNIDADGILGVTAVDEETGVENNITVQSSRLTASEREQMIRNARKMAEEQKIEMAKREARSTFADAIMRIKVGIHSAPTEQIKCRMLEIIKREENWINTNKIPTEEELYGHARSMNELMKQLMNRNY